MRVLLVLSICVLAILAIPTAILATQPATPEPYDVLQDARIARLQSQVRTLSARVYCLEHLVYRGDVVGPDPIRCRDFWTR